ncbi:hypothetical protein QBC47DRAFT_299226 [Echria macrotheca]|uniref:SET domain-containing protein n=1 Tax=Echria macrotheca TaxID=438768 RepID=A0AAJ0BFG7_9PEZI|nr:hypothetical protein QBC47DRAFT_299226 [Echria macrotheca]
MKLSQFVSVYAAAVLAHSSDHQHHHHHADLGGVCGSGALPDSTCQPDTEYLPGAQKEIFAEKEDGWRCPNGTSCEHAHKHSWTHSSPCFVGSKTGQDFCVFTDTEFADGRGTSFVMTRRRADYLTTYSAFTDPGFVSGVNQDLVRTIPAVYDVHEFPGKGMGLVANQFIRRGELIMANTASLMIDYRVFHELKKEEYKELQLHAVNYLPDPHRKAFMNLSTHGQTFSTLVDTVEKIAETNAFDIDPDADDEEQNYGFFVVFPEIARFNHDCRPNADYYFEHRSLTQYIHATRDIQPGEELTLSYINTVMTRNERLRKLNHNWGFQCACSACTQEKARADVSDMRIRRIKDLRPKMRNWKAGSVATPQMAELLISLYEQERLWGSMYNAYSFAAYEYNAVGDPWTAIKYAMLAIEWGIPMVGATSSEVTDMEKLVEDPWGHWSWMHRVKKRSGWARDPDEEEEEEDD